MKKKLLSPRIDVVFKMIFGVEENSDILVDFLQSAVELPPEDYEIISIVDPQLDREEPGDKLAVLDVKIKTATGKLIDIEIQLCNSRWMKERIVYYTSKMITGQVRAGDNYSKIQKVITIVITDFRLIKDSDAYANRFALRTESGLLFSDTLEIVTLELPKIPKEGGGKLYDWLRFFKAEKEEEYMTVAMHNPKIGRAVAVLEELSEDESTRMIAEGREKQRRDQEAREYYAFDQGEIKGMKKGRRKGKQEGIAEGLEKGLEQGRQEGMARIVQAARRLKSCGLEAADIALCTGLSPEQIADL